MDRNKTPEPIGRNYASLCCYSPVIPLTGVGIGVIWTGVEAATATVLQLPMYCQNSNSAELVTNQRIDKSPWICNYSDDIFQTLREAELRRNVLCFQSEQCGFRPALLRLLKVATEVHKLSRTTLHLALYLLDGFMDNYTIRTEKLNLTALTCLIIAAKIEEADMNTPKFVELNKIVGDVYTLDDFRRAEMKVLMHFHFDLIRPTAATFAEYFANHIITLDDYHIYWQNYHCGVFGYRSLLQHQLGDTQLDVVPTIYRNYEEMAATLSKLLFSLVDESLSYIKFVNAQPSVIAAACLATARNLSFVTPIWTSYLVKITKCTQDIVEPIMEALIAVHNLHLSKERAMLFAATELRNNAAALCDSPDSGFVSLGDTKSESSDNDSDDEYTGLSCGECTMLPSESICSAPCAREKDEEQQEICVECPILLRKRKRSGACDGESSEQQRSTTCVDEACLSLKKRRRIFENGSYVEE